MIDPLHPDYTDTPVSSKRPPFHYVPLNRDAKPHVTIVTPFFNTGAIFHQTAQSILQQSLQQWEWLIINDGSTDVESLAVLDRYRDRDVRIRVIDHPENRGLSASRNTGFRASRTDYVLQLDSDDLLEPRAAETWFWCLESRPEFAFVSGYTVHFGDHQGLWEGGFHEAETFLRENRVDANTMIRKSVHAAAGGYNEVNRGGLEDWEFWLRCADLGHWGGTVPEYGDWYRRRLVHSSSWANWDGGPRQEAFGHELRRKYGGLWAGQFPCVSPGQHVRHEWVRDDLPCENRLRKDNPRLLLVLPSISGHSGESHLKLLELLCGQGWQVTVAATARSEVSIAAQLARITPDIFILPHFLALVDYPRFIRYLIGSRDVDAVLISGSEFGYTLLPYLRAHYPRLPLVDHCVTNTGPWSLLSERYAGMLDHHLVGPESSDGKTLGTGATVRSDGERVNGPARAGGSTEDGSVVANELAKVVREVHELSDDRTESAPSLELGLIAASQAVEGERLLGVASDAVGWAEQADSRLRDLEARMAISESRIQVAEEGMHDVESRVIRIYESLPARLYRRAKSLPAARRLGRRLLRI